MLQLAGNWLHGRGLQLFQSGGGRADRYIFESWHIGPHQIVPETQEGTYTNLVSDAIKYLKGTNQKLDLSVATPGGLIVGAGIYQTIAAQTQSITAKAKTTGPLTYEVKLQNNGEVACMPTLRAQGGATISMKNKDLSASARSVEGHVFTGMIAPGKSLSVSVTLPAGQKTLLQAFWNPQDAGMVRDAIALSATQ